MDLSRSSKITKDPLSHVLVVLGARVTRLTRFEASGQWAFWFPAVDRLKFIAVLRGTQWAWRSGFPPIFMSPGDICLLGRTDYAVASHPNLRPVDGQSLYDGAGRDVARIGGDDTVAVGGTVIFADANADFLLEMLPDFMLIPRTSAASGTISTILTLMASEIEREKLGSEIVSTRLADVLVVEAIRVYAGELGQSGIGWLGALLDPRLGRALRAMHDDVAGPWTVSALAGVAGMSRAAFSAEFARRIGQPPLAYLRTWRLTMARSALLQGDASVDSIARTVGYSSQSAFSHAFRRAFGVSPRSNFPQ